MAGRHVTDARVRRTQRRLRDAIVSLIHEKSYPIVVKEILERADVGGAAFYGHFLNKDTLFGQRDRADATRDRAAHIATRLRIPRAPRR